MATLPAGTKLAPYQLYALFIWAGFDRADAANMTAIALAESGGTVDVVNSIGATGIVQIYLKAHPDVSPEQAKDPVFSAQYAYRLYTGRGGKSAGERRFYDWEAWTGPDGKGSDGPWQRYQGLAILAATQFAASAVSATGPDGGRGVPDVEVAKAVIAATYLQHGLTGALGGVVADAAGVIPGVLAAGASAAADVPSALLQALGPLETVARAVIATADWLADRNNWIRLAKGTVGGVLVIVGLQIVARPVTQPIASAVAGAVPAGRIVKAVG